MGRLMSGTSRPYSQLYMSRQLPLSISMEVRVLKPGPRTFFVVTSTTSKAFVSSLATRKIDLSRDVTTSNEVIIGTQIDIKEAGAITYVWIDGFHDPKCCDYQK
jgi:hypothetical protein